MNLAISIAATNRVPGNLPGNHGSLRSKKLPTKQPISSPWPTSRRCGPKKSSSAKNTASASHRQHRREEPGGAWDFGTRRLQLGGLVGQLGHGVVEGCGHRLQIHHVVAEALDVLCEVGGALVEFGGASRGGLQIGVAAFVVCIAFICFALAASLRLTRPGEGTEPLP